MTMPSTPSPCRHNTQGAFRIVHDSIWQEKSVAAATYARWRHLINDATVPSVGDGQDLRNFFAPKASTWTILEPWAKVRRSAGRLDLDGSGWIWIDLDSWGLQVLSDGISMCQLLSVGWVRTVPAQPAWLATLSTVKHEWLKHPCNPSVFWHSETRTHTFNRKKHQYETIIKHLRQSTCLEAIRSLYFQWFTRFFLKNKS